MNLANAITLLVVLNIIVIAHEFGHFFWARRFGTKVHEFSVGFGPLLSKHVRDGIQYSLRAVPLGGFVKISGMDIALEGQEDEEAAVAPEERFSALPLLKKIIVIIAGSVNNLAIGVILLIIVAAFVGIPYEAEMDRAIAHIVLPKSPAYEAGLSPGDQILAIDGKTIKNWDEMVGIIYKSPNKPLVFTISRKGRVFTRRITPIYDPKAKIGLIGIHAPYKTKRLPLGEAFVFGFQRSWELLYGNTVALLRIITGKERANLMGPFGMIGYVGQARETGPDYFLQVCATISLFLGFFNLLPIPLPLLDGGWVVIFLLERLRRKEFSPEQKSIAQMVGLGLLLLLFIFVTYSDIGSDVQRLFHLP
ncbi:MAG TPA: M50 family metallopeptidase [Bacillota bacterium]|nr:M50 family metallopeptidase [Bacillota bacterium]